MEDVDVAIHEQSQETGPAQMETENLEASGQGGFLTDIMEEVEVGAQTYGRPPNGRVLIDIWENRNLLM